MGNTHQEMEALKLELRNIITDLDAVKNEIRAAGYQGIGTDICASRLENKLNSLQYAKKKLDKVHTYNWWPF